MEGKNLELYIVATTNKKGFSFYCWGNDQPSEIVGLDSALNNMHKNLALPSGVKLTKAEIFDDNNCLVLGLPTIDRGTIINTFEKVYESNGHKVVSVQEFY